MPSPVLARRLITPFRSKLLAEYAVNGFFGGITSARATSLWLPNASASLVEYVAGEVGIVDGDSIWCQPGATNKLTYSDNLSQWSNGGNIVHPPVASGGTGPRGQTAYEIEDTSSSAAGNAFLSVTVTSNTNPSTMRFWLRKTASASFFPGVRIQFGGSPTASAIINTNAVTGVVYAGTGTLMLRQVGDFIEGALEAANTSQTSGFAVLFPALSTNGTIASNTPTGATEFFDVEFHEGKTADQVFKTSPVPTSGSSIAIGATEPKIPSVSGLTNNLAGRLYWTPQADDQGTVWILGNYTDADNAWGILHDGTNLIFRNRVSGTNNDATIALNYVTDTEYRIDYRLAESGLDIAVDGTKGTTDSTTTDLTNATNTYYGQDGNDANHCFCSIRAHSEKKVASNITDAEWLA